MLRLAQAYSAPSSARAFSQSLGRIPIKKIRAQGPVDLRQKYAKLERTSPQKKEVPEDVKEKRKALQRAHYAANKDKILEKARRTRVEKAIKARATGTKMTAFHVLDFFLDKKVERVEVFDVSSRTPYADFYIFLDCASAKSMQVISRNLIKLGRSVGDSAAANQMSTDACRGVDDWTIADLGSTWVYLFTDNEDGQMRRKELSELHADLQVPFAQWHKMQHHWDRAEPVIVDQDRTPNMQDDTEHFGLEEAPAHFPDPKPWRLG